MDWEEDKFAARFVFHQLRGLLPVVERAGRLNQYRLKPGP